MFVGISLGKHFDIKWISDENEFRVKSTIANHSAMLSKETVQFYDLHSAPRIIMTSYLSKLIIPNYDA